MANKRKWLILFMFFSLLILVTGAILVYVKENEGSATLHCELLGRIANLKELSFLVKEYEKEYPYNSNFDFFDIISDTNAYTDCFVLGTNTDRSKLSSGVSRDEFYRICEYRFLKGGLGWWCIIEIKHGWGEYYLFITKDGEIKKINIPIDVLNVNTNGKLQVDSQDK